MAQKIKKKQDSETRRIFKALKKQFAGLPDDIDQVVYRYNPGAIRVRVIDDAFRGKSYSERELLIDPVLDSLPEDIRRDITLLLLLTPQEAKSSNDLMNLEFDDPVGSRL
jgi:hypothetical protein